MNIKKSLFIPKICLLSLLLLIASCTTPLAYNPAYEGTLQPIPGAQLSGRGVILTTEVDDNYVFVGNPTSFTGGGTEISIPLGLITKEIAQHAFERMFSDGVVQARNLDSISSYEVVITPRVANFSYAYNQLKNAGFLVTPQVDISLSVDIFDSKKNKIRSNLFTSGIKDGDSYAFSGKPAERINQLAHEVVTELLNQAASDVYYLLVNQRN
jgi:hypothetical protein